jgi:O-antigen/teichoic acid export membrane protein
MMESSKGLVIKGVFWNAVQLVVNQSFTFVIRLVLARLLFPEQFGLIGMATVFTGLIQVLNDLGIGAAIVQKKDEDLTEAHYHTAFWTGVVWSLFLYVLISIFVAPIGASFYAEPLLTYLVPVMSLGILFSPVNLIHKAQMTKVMNFKKMAFIDNTSNIIAGCLSLVLAFKGAGVWSLAFNAVATVVIAMPLYFHATGWKPKWIWTKAAFKDVFGFGIYTTGTSVINYGINNIDFLIIGKLLSAQALGAYSFAFVLTDTFRSRLMLVVNNVMYPFYGKKQSDPISLKSYYLKVIRYNSIVIYPIMVFMVVLGEPFIVTFFGSKWKDAVTPLQILSFSVMIHMLVNSNTALIRGMGRPDLEMKLQTLKAVIFIPMLILGIYQYGIIGAAWAVLINKVIAVIIAQYTFNYLLNIKLSTFEFLQSIKEAWIASIVAYLVTGFSYNVLHMHFILCGMILMLFYFLIIWMLMGNEISLHVKQYRSSSK